MDIQVIVDNKNSWIIPYAEKLTASLNGEGHSCRLIHDQSELRQGDVLFLLGCEKILKKEQMDLHRHNIVIHESALPQGKGWSPLTWQVLEGKKEIPVTLFEATEAVDAGSIYLQSSISLTGTELVDELREKQGSATIDLAREFIERYSELEARPQVGTESFYKRRRPEDSRLDINRTIKEQFNLLRVCDNVRYPAFFDIEGQRYLLTIRKEEKL